MTSTDTNKFTSGYRMANGLMACRLNPPLTGGPDIAPSGLTAGQLLGRLDGLSYIPAGPPPQNRPSVLGFR